MPLFLTLSFRGCALLVGNVLCVRRWRDGEIRARTVVWCGGRRRSGRRRNLGSCRVFTRGSVLFVVLARVPIVRSIVIVVLVITLIVALVVIVIPAIPIVSVAIPAVTVAAPVIAPAITSVVPSVITSISTSPVFTVSIPLSPS